jgi:3-deoxy-D-manno-octulosonate 8-phosphate phosphatase (KDO 8-P phosphatase)
MGRLDKLNVLQDIAAKYKFTAEEFAFIGDDIPDLPALEYAGLSAAPANAHDEVKGSVDIVLKRCGGDGAVREFLDFLLKAREM